MLCNIYRGSAEDVLEAPWKQKIRSTTVTPVVVRRSGHASQEIEQLQSKIQELTALAEQRVKDAWEQGRRAGETTVRKSLEDQVRVATEGLAKAVTEVASTRPEIIRRAEHDTVRLAVEIARRVLHRELAVDRSALEGLIKAAISKLQTQDVYRVRVHPDQEKLMRSCLEQSGRGSVEIMTDPSRSKGTVSFEISRGTLDASVETQLREIENGLADEMRRRS